MTECHSWWRCNFKEERIILCSYRPFVKRFLYYDQYVNEMRVFDNDWGLEEMVNFRNQGVNPSFVDELFTAGIADLEADDLINLRVNRVSPSYVTGMIEAGLTDPSIDDLISLSNQGVTKNIVRELVEAGNSDPSVDELIDHERKR